MVGGAGEAARRAAELIAEAAEAAIAERGSFSIALSGGRTPWRMLDCLAPDALDREGVSIFQVDERVAPDGDPDRNLTRLRAHLPAGAVARLRPMPVTAGDLEAAAREYERALPATLDLVHLGLGADGHTASLVPGDPVLEVADRRVALTGGEYQGRRRMTLTYPALAAARRVLLLVSGEDKRDPLARVLAGDDSIPAGRVRSRDLVIVADESAAG